MKPEKNNIKLVNQIEFHLWPSYWWFLYELHEDLVFNLDSFNILLKLIKELKKRELSPCELESNFVYLLISKITYLYDILRDLYEHKNNFNLTIDEYYEYILELKYEIESLFIYTLNIDYHWNKYWD